MSETQTKTPTIRRITPQRLQNLLSSVVGAKMCTIITETEPRMRKTNNPFLGQIFKRSRMNVTINFIYANSVNNQRNKEGNVPDFTPEPRKWGQRIEHTCLVLHNERLYLECKPNGTPAFVEYWNQVTGEPVDKATLVEWLYEPNSNADHQGVEKEIIVRDFALSSIRELILGGVHYKVRN